MLLASDPRIDVPYTYIGEAETIRDRLKQHKTIEFWISATAFVNEDENLTEVM